MPDRASPRASRATPSPLDCKPFARVEPVTPRAPLPPPPRRSLHRGALSHAALWLALALAGCSRSEGGGDRPAQSPAEIARALDEVAAAATPIDVAATSDKQDEWMTKLREVLERHRAGSQELGEAALERFNLKKDERPVRIALLDVAAHCAPETTAPVLEKAINTYDGQEGLELRSRAVEYLAQTSPQRAIALFEPVLRDAVPRATRPPQENFVRGWATAARALKLSDALILADLAVDLGQAPDARYAAIDELAKFGGPRSIQALDEVLVEAASDGLMRRKAAQALAIVMPREQFCARLTTLAEHESDANFIDFLDSMLNRYCAQ